MPPKKNLTRATSAASREIEGRIRAQLEGGRLQMADVLRSERELAAEHGVSRRTVRKALQQLVADGYLVSKPRGGYAVAATVRPEPKQVDEEGLIAFVHGTPGMPWEWSEFNVALWNGFQQCAGRDGRSILAISIANRTPAELVRSLKAQGVAGAIVDSDFLEITDAIFEAGMGVVHVDAVHAQAPSITQDNFRGAFSATRHLIEKGCKRIAFLGCDFSPNPNRMHLEERMGGYLSALTEAKFEVNPEWQILGHPVEPAVERLVELSVRKGGPDGVVVFWAELLDDLGAALECGRLDLETVVWWGCVPERRTRWAAQHPTLKVPTGLAWSADEMARAAFLRMKDQLEGSRGFASRTSVPVRLVPGEER